MGMIGNLFNRHRVGPTIENANAMNPAAHMNQAEINKRDMKTAADMAYHKKYNELLAKSNTTNAEARAVRDVERVTETKQDKLNRFAHKIEGMKAGYKGMSEAMSKNPMFSGSGMNPMAFGHQKKHAAPKQTKKVLSHYIQQGEKMIPVYKDVQATTPKKKAPEYPRWY